MDEVLQALSVSMQSPPGSGSAPLQLASLGIAYLALTANLLLTAALFAASRLWLVVSPNRAARDYGLYVSTVLATIVLATVLENRLLPAGTATLHYEALPHLLILLVLHVAVYQRAEPRNIALAVSALGGALPVFAVFGALQSGGLRPAHWAIIGPLGLLLGYAGWRSISTKRGFMKASSIYVGSKEQGETSALAQKPWLGLAQWVTLGVASLLLAVVNALLGGVTVTEIPAVRVVGEATLLIGATTLVSTIPASTYWLAHRRWMPELTRFVWLVWLVVGFAFLYGTFLTSLDRI